jgi:DNA-binding SARP family transcriptional activator
MSTTIEPTVSVRLLGTFSLTIDGSQVHRWRAGKARSLFQYLLVHRGHVVLRDKLYEVLWPDSVWSPNSSSLKVAMHALRQILHIDQDGSGADGVRIVRQDFGYALYADRIWVDVDEFENRFRAGRAASEAGDEDLALTCYADAMAVYEGDFLVGDTADWVIEQREWCRSIALRALQALCAGAVRRRDYSEILYWCRRIIELDPYQEQAYQMLMEVHGSFGELGTVRRWYDLCSRRLRDELDVAPSQETTRLYNRAMRDELRRADAMPPIASRPALSVVRPLPARTEPLFLASLPSQRDAS